jgi:beta-glucosidase
LYKINSNVNRRSINMKDVWGHSGSMDQSLSELEIRHRTLAREAAVEGIVLLKNEGVLPLSTASAIALLGSGAEKTIKGGIGSGDVNNRENISIYQGMKEAGVTITSEDWLEDYEERYKNARNVWKEKILEDAKHVDNPFDAYASNPFILPEGRAVEAKDIAGAKAAVYVLSRISGEGKDRRRVKGDYYLSEREAADLFFLNEKKIPVILLLNAGGPIELTDILENTENIKAILNISQPGQESGYAVADILLGNCVPSAKLTATWARRYEDCPFAENYSYLNGNLDTEEYKEGIFVGYRYFDSFGKKPLFPFGFGLSYTEFKIEFKGIETSEKELTVEMKVTNIGDTYAGKEVVQIYASLPQTEVKKEYRRLVGYAKTKLLQPGEAETLKITVGQKELAYFSEEKHQWIIEKGTYGIWTGNSSVSLEYSSTVKVEQSVSLEDSCVLENTAEIEEELWKTYECRKTTADNSRCIVFTPHPEEKKIYRSAYATEQMTEDLIPLLYGNIAETTSTLGAAGIRVPGTAGETTEGLLDKYGIPSLIMADGPAGIRLQQHYEVDRATDTVYGIGVLGALENGFLVDREEHEGADQYYQYCTAFPVGTVMAQTWNRDLMQRFGEAVALEMEAFHVNLWLAPGLNIQRNPLCGRNFEYYSEDPFLSGTLAASVTKGVQCHKGCGVTIKHFACNNQEDNRMGVDVKISERTLREIYLRGFEIAVKEGQPTAIMSSYNLVNGVHAANSKDLCTRIARKEWGFDGVIMSDWNTTVPEDGSVAWKCAAAGNDIIMPGNAEDAESIRNAYRNGDLTEEEIRSCAGRILELISQLA